MQKSDLVNIEWRHNDLHHHTITMMNVLNLSIGLEWDRVHYYCLIDQPWMIDGGDSGAISGMNDRDEEPCPSAALSTSCPPGFGKGSNEGRTICIT
jgi:hypothetical protein